MTFTASAAIALALVAQFTPALASLGFDPALISPLNFGILVYMVIFTHREITTLRRQSVAAAAELVRTAKGSETRAEKAAAEITATKQKIEDAAAQVVVLVRVVKDEMRRARGEWDRLDDARHGHDEPTPPRADP